LDFEDTNGMIVGPADRLNPVEAEAWFNDNHIILGERFL
jgi:hypothetical protein